MAERNDEEIHVAAPLVTDVAHDLVGDNLLFSLRCELVAAVATGEGQWVVERSGFDPCKAGVLQKFEAGVLHELFPVGATRGAPIRKYVDS